MNGTFRLKRSQLNPGQWKAIHCRDPVVLMSGGFGSGKTTALAMKILQLKTANPGVPGLVISQTWRALWSTTVRALVRLMRDMGAPTPVVRDRQGECYLDFGDGVPVFLRSATNPDSFDGLDVGWAGGDELRHWPEQSYHVLLGRVRVKCPFSQIFFASTPEWHWMADEFDTGKPERTVIVAPTRENARNLKPGFIQGLRLTYSKRLQDAVIDGIFTILEGAVYSDLASDIWNSPWCVDHKYNKALHTYLAVDPGVQRSSWLFIQKRSKWDWVVFDQMQLDDVSDTDAVAKVNGKGYKIDEIWTDPAANNRQSGFALTTVDIMKGIKVRSPNAIHYITPPFNGISFGVERMRGLFGTTNDVDHPKPIRLRFAKSLRKTEIGATRGIVRDVMAYRYPPIKEGRSVTNEPWKDGKVDHSNDALRYFGVGVYLREGLRTLDHEARNMAKGKPGYRTAA